MYGEAERRTLLNLIQAVDKNQVLLSIEKSAPVQIAKHELWKQVTDSFNEITGRKASIFKLNKLLHRMKKNRLKCGRYLEYDKDLGRWIILWRENIVRGSKHLFIHYLTMSKFRLLQYNKLIFLRLFLNKERETVSLHISRRFAVHSWRCTALCKIFYFFKNQPGASFTQPSTIFLHNPVDTFQTLDSSLICCYLYKCDTSPQYM